MQEKEAKEKKLAAKVARLYYEDGLSFLEIGDMLGISRQRCSRLLKKAREIGIVQIKILDQGENRVPEYEQYFLDHFTLKKVVVVEVFSDDSELIRKSVGEAGAKLLTSLLRPGMNIGVAYGRTLLNLVHYLKPNRNDISNLSIVQIMGGLSRISADVVATEIPRRLAGALNAQVYYLPAPAFTKDKKTRDAMLSDDTIQATLSENLDVALVGIGGVSLDSTLISTGAISAAEFAELKAKGAVGDIAGTYYDIDGNIVDFGGNQRRIAFSLEDLRQCQYVVGVAGGLEKEETILGALRGKLINCLVVDNVTAQKIIDREMNNTRR